MDVFAIDPGPTKSAYVVWNGSFIFSAGMFNNNLLLSILLRRPMVRVLAIEKMASYGMPVGKEVMETIFWSGRFAQAWGNDTLLIRKSRKEVCLYLCNSARAGDSNIRQRLIDLYGKPPTKKEPNPVYNGNKIVRDLWQAWALAVTVYDELKNKSKDEPKTT